MGLLYTPLSRSVCQAVPACLSVCLHVSLRPSCCVHQAVQDAGEKLVAESDLLTDEIHTRLAQLAANWDELRQLTATRAQKLDESLEYQQFSAGVEEEQAWISEKQHLLSGEDTGDTLAKVQVRGGVGGGGRGGGGEMRRGG